MAGVVTITGTVSQPRLKTIQQGGVGTTYGVSAMSGPTNAGSGGTDMDYRWCATHDLNFFQELQGFIAEMGRTCSMTPVACIDQLVMMLAEMRRQPTMTEGARLFLGAGAT
jgi:hypothetical protein